MKNQYLRFLVFFLLTYYCGSSQGKVSTFTIEAPQLKTSKKIWMYLPHNYETSEKKYPVLYMHDAQNLFDAKTSYAGEWRIDETLDSLKAEIIVVGIEHGNEKRLDELTPFPNKEYGGGNANAYLDFIVNQLKPYIDSNYRTKTNKMNTAIGGSSLGGLVSYYAILKYPEIFGKAMVFSPSFWFNEEMYSLTENAKKLKTKLYFMCGDSESETMVSDMDKMTHLVNEKRCTCMHLTKKVVVTGGKHNENLWAKEFGKAYLWLF
ncbi:alpha/beta hydrolase [Flavobacterium channae]|uniref:alpha/beta hydrolase n=1 Tax=Flavobacterium channae TaxID=2897181 RepID=UPI001E5A87B9|nr:alpha/beta hydrolase-fold protein [Flavobacterium channae]UGS22848.1 alpha/beta hydrolase [Flavobacterium channae]